MTMLYFIYLRAIKVEEYVIFLYKGSMYTQYIYYVYIEVYVKFQIDVIEKL